MPASTRPPTGWGPASARVGVAEPAVYIEALDALGCDVDAWETTYQHILDPRGEQDSPVLEWVRGTGLRPVLDALTDEAERSAFLADYDARLRAAYPRTAAGWCSRSGVSSPSPTAARRCPA